MRAISGSTQDLCIRRGSETAWLLFFACQLRFTANFSKALCGAVMVVMAVVMMVCGGKGRAGKDEDQEGSSNYLLHGKNLA